MARLMQKNQMKDWVKNRARLFVGPKNEKEYGDMTGDTGVKMRKVTPIRPLDKMPMGRIRTKMPAIQQRKLIGPKASELELVDRKRQKIKNKLKSY